MLKDSQSLPMCNTQGKQIEYIFFNFYKKLFFFAAQWNSFESFFYQLIFLSHQCGLFLLCDRSLYGKAGSIFALSYLIITFLLSGAEGSFLPFFKDYTSSQNTFKTFLKHYIVKHMVILTSIIFTGIFCSFFIFKDFSKILLILFGCFIIIESFKKLLKQLLYLAFYNKYTACFEILQLLFYVATIWILYFLGIPFSLYLFFTPFIVFSFFTCLLYWRLLQNYSKTLFALKEPAHLPTFYSIITIRCIVLINQISHLLFSGNCIVPFFALYSGFSQAGVFTFINYLTNTITFFLYKICIPPAEALFSKVHYFSFYTRYNALKYTLYLFASLTLFLGIILFFTKQHIALLFNVSLPSQSNTLLFFFFIHLLETMFIIYEKFFLIHRKMKYITIGNLITCAFCFIVTKLSFPFTTIVTVCFFIRFLFFLTLSCLIILSKSPSDQRFESNE